MENSAYYAVVPADVRYDKSLPDKAKLLYGEITALSNQQGYCWAENEHFEELYDVNERTVRRWINALVGKGYIRRELEYAADGKTIKRRRLIINRGLQERVDDCHEMSPPGGKNVPTPGGKNVPTQLINNKNINNKYNITPLIPLIENSDFSERVKTKLSEWIKYKDERGDKYTEIGFRALLTRLKKFINGFGDSKVINLIDESIVNNWKGIIWDKLQPVGAAVGVTMQSAEELNGIFAHIKPEDI